MNRAHVCSGLCTPFMRAQKLPSLMVRNSQLEGTTEAAKSDVSCERGRAREREREREREGGRGRERGREGEGEREGGREREIVVRNAATKILEGKCLSMANRIHANYMIVCTIIL